MGKVLALADDTEGTYKDNHVILTATIDFRKLINSREKCALK